MRGRALCAKMPAMSELDELERELLQAADTWFAAHLHRKLQRLIEIAREGEKMRIAASTKRLESVGENISPLDTSNC